MGIYLIALFLSLFFAFFSKKINNKLISTIFMFLSVFPLFILSAFRYDVGTDYLGRYVSAYKIIASGGDVLSLEILFRYLIRICLIFSRDSSVLFFVTSLIIDFGMFYLIYKYSNEHFLSIILFFGLGFYFQSLNLVRQYLAMILLLFSFFSLKKRNFVLAILLFLFSIFTHNSAVIGALYYFLYVKSKVGDKKNVLSLVLILLFICIFRTPLSFVLKYIIRHTSFSGYIGSIFDVSQFNIFSFAIHLIFIYFMTIVKKEFDVDGKPGNFYFNVQMCTLIFCSLSSIFSLFSRIMIYFSIFLIFSIPYYVSQITLSKKKMMAYFIIFCLLFLNIINSNIVHNYNEVIPYKSIFNKVR